MKLRFSFWKILLHFLAVMCFHGSGAREMPKEELMVAPKIPEVNVLQLHSMDGRKQHGDHDHERGDETQKREDTRHMHLHGHGHSSLSHMDMDDHLDPAAITFFTVKDLKPGKTLPIYFAKQDPASSPPPLLHKE